MSASLALPRMPDKIVLEPVLSNQEFEELCEANDCFRLERTSEGAILVNPVSGMAASEGKSEIGYQLVAWWKTHRRGRAHDSSIGVFLPDGSALGPDAAYVTEAQTRGLRKRADAGRSGKQGGRHGTCGWLCAGARGRMAELRALRTR